MEEDKISGKILIHIAFHYAEERFKYLKQLIDNFDTYRFTEIDIVIDTNSEATEKLIHESAVFHKGKLECTVHKNLSHPYLLTWQHREDMLRKINNYDFFMYTEDDILAPWKAIERWYKDTLNIYPHGFVRGFLSVEKNAEGILMATSITERFAPDLIKIGGVKYFTLPRPYHALWIYTKEQMMEFIHHQSWKNGNHDKWGIRERAAAGMMWKGQNFCRALIPIEEENKVPEETLVYHLPNNYALDEKSRFAKIPANEIFCSSIEWFIRKRLNEFYFFLQKSLRNFP